MSKQKEGPAVSAAGPVIPLGSEYEKPTTKIGRTVIPDEAVEVAARVMAGQTDEPTYGTYPDLDVEYRRDARAILEAVAPHLRSQALTDAADTLEAAEPMHQAQYVAFLRVCAASETKRAPK